MKVQMRNPFLWGLRAEALSLWWEGDQGPPLMRSMPLYTWLVWDQTVDHWRREKEGLFPFYAVGRERKGAGGGGAFLGKMPGLLCVSTRVFCLQRPAWGASQRSRDLHLAWVLAG